MRQWFRDLKVGAKLALGFSVMIAFIGLIGFIGYRSLTRIEQNLDEIFEVHWPSINYILEADRDLFQLVVAERSMMFSDTSTKSFQDFQALYEENRQQSDERWQKYKALMRTDQEKALVPEYENARMQWELSAKKVIEGIMATAPDNRWRVRDLALGEVQEKFEAMREYLDRLTEMNQQMAKDAHNDARKVYAGTILLFLTLIGVGLLVGLGFAIAIGLGITVPLKKAVNISSKLAEGDLTQNISSDRKDETGQLLTAMDDMIHILRQVVTEVGGAAQYVASGSQQMSASATQLSEGASEQAASAEELSSSMEEMAANINQNTDNATLTEKIAVQAAVAAQKSGKRIKKTIKAMKQIAKEIDSIEQISQQTRMLSLNATIEAGKAQDYGKGFAVVASEVRQLAGLTQKTAEKINKLVTSGVSSVKKSGEDILNLVPDIQKTAELVQEISAASGEQSSGANQVNLAVQQLDTIIQEHSATSEQLASTAEELAAQSIQLQNTIAFFKIEERKKIHGSGQQAANGNTRQEGEQPPNAEKPTQKDDEKGVSLEITGEKARKDAHDDDFERF